MIVLIVMMIWLWSCLLFYIRSVVLFIFHLASCEFFYFPPYSLLLDTRKSQYREIFNLYSLCISVFLLRESSSKFDKPPSYLICHFSVFLFVTNILHDFLHTRKIHGAKINILFSYKEEILKS